MYLAMLASDFCFSRRNGNQEPCSCHSRFVHFSFRLLSVGLLTGLRWGREFEEDHPRMKQVRADFLRRKQNERSFDDLAEEKGEKLKHSLKQFLLLFLLLIV